MINCSKTFSEIKKEEVKWKELLRLNWPALPEVARKSYQSVMPSYKYQFIRLRRLYPNNISESSYEKFVEMGASSMPLIPIVVPLTNIGLTHKLYIISPILPVSSNKYRDINLK